MDRGQRFQETPRSPTTDHVRRVVHGYLRMEEPDEAQISVWRHDISAFCRLGDYELGSVFIDRGVPDDVFARTGFTRLLAALRAPEGHAVVVPTLDHLSTQAFVRDALVRMVELTGCETLEACSVPDSESGQQPELVAADRRFSDPHTDNDQAHQRWSEAPAISHLLPTDAGWRADKVLIGELSNLSMSVAKYIMRYLDADAGRKEPISVDEEQALGGQLVQLGQALQDRAAQRSAGDDTGLLVDGAV